MNYIKLSLYYILSMTTAYQIDQSIFVDPNLCQYVNNFIDLYYIDKPRKYQLNNRAYLKRDLKASRLTPMVRSFRVHLFLDKDIEILIKPCLKPKTTEEKVTCFWCNNREIIQQKRVEGDDIICELCHPYYWGDTKFCRHNSKRPLFELNAYGRQYINNNCSDYKFIQS